MTFAELYAAVAGRLPGRAWRIQVQAATWLPAGEILWEIYVEKLHIPFATGKTAEVALAMLDAALATEASSGPERVEDVGTPTVNP